MSLKNSLIRSSSWVLVSGLISWSVLMTVLPAAMISRPFFMQSLAAAMSTSPRTGSEPFLRLNATWVSGESITRASSACAAEISSSSISGK